MHPTFTPGSNATYAYTTDLLRFSHPYIGLWLPSDKWETNHGGDSSSDTMIQTETTEK